MRRKTVLLLPLSALAVCVCLAVGQDGPLSSSTERATPSAASPSGDENALTESTPRGVINAPFIDWELDVREFLGRFEIESREVYAARERILDACQLTPGMSVADIGAGTGFFTAMFSSSVGQQGWVYAVEISPRFLEHINQRIMENSINNVTGVYCRDNSISLPPNSIDLAFICDTYHHFEFPAETVASIRRALRKDGVLVVVDFERIPGESREWVLSHVCAGKQTVRQEIESVGFGLQRQVTIPGLSENYFLRFKKR